jgi:hypothetical protein
MDFPSRLFEPGQTSIAARLDIIAFPADHLKITADRI